MRKASILMASSGLITMALASPALAQSGPLPADNAAPADNGGVEEIIVTAQKSSQRLQDTALSIQAITGAGLERQGITNAQDLVGRVLGINMFPIGNGVNIMIRGIGSTSVSAQNETTSAFEVDGVYRAKPSSTAAVFYDVDRVEVLKGPQGTLYGRNATVGAVRVITRDPTFKTEGTATIEAGSYNAWRVFAAANAPLSETLAIRVAGQISRRDGYTSNGTNDAHDDSARIKLLWKPTPELTLLTTADYYLRGGAGPGSVTLNTVPVTSSTPANSAARDPISGAQFFTAQGPYTSNFAAGSSRVKDWGVSTVATYDLGDTVLTVQPAYRYSLLNSRGQANSGVPLGTVQDIEAKQFSTEIRLNSREGSPVRWVVGGYYFREKTIQLLNSITLTTALPSTAPTSTTFPNTDPGRTGGVTYGIFNTDSLAAFGQVTVPVTETFRLTGGLRYTTERKTLGGEGYSYRFSALAPDYDGAAPADRVAGTTFALSSRSRFERVNWKAGFEFNFREGSMLYFNASTGFKAGGANAVDSATAPAAAQRDFAPETLLEYAGGIKNSFMDGKLVVNLEGYRWEYNGRQQLYRTAINGSGLIRFINTNLGKQIIWGGAVEVAARPTRNDRVGFNVSYDRGKFTNDPMNYLIAQGLNDFRNQRVPFQAPWQASWNWTHDFPLANGATVSVEYAGRYASGHFTETRLTPLTYQNSYAKHDLSLSYETAGGGLTVRAWVRNLTDRAVLGSALTSNTIVPGNQPYIGYYEPPRTWGGTATVKF